MKYVKITRSDAGGSCIQTVNELEHCIGSEFDDIEDMQPGVSVTLTVVEMAKEEYAKLDEFMGW